MCFHLPPGQTGKKGHERKVRPGDKRKGERSDRGTSEREKGQTRVQEEGRKEVKGRERGKEPGRTRIACGCGCGWWFDERCLPLATFVRLWTRSNPDVDGAPGRCRCFTDGRHGEKHGPSPSPTLLRTWTSSRPPVQVDPRTVAIDAKVRVGRASCASTSGW